MQPFRLSLAQWVCRPMPPLLGAVLRDYIFYPLKTAEHDDFTFTVKSQTGSLYTNKTSDSLGYAFSVQGWSEWRNWAVALAVCKPGDTIIEVGSHVGTETIGFADIVGCNGHVFAFEAFPPHVEILRSSIRHAKCDNITIMPIALSDRNGHLSFKAPRKDNSGTGHVVLEDQTNLAEDVIDVESHKLDELVNQVGSAQFICMDTEGSESLILQGAREYIREYCPAIMLEVDAEVNLPRFNLTQQDVFGLLQSMDYEVMRVGRFGLEPINFDNPHIINWFCIHRNRADLFRDVHRSIRQCGFMPCLPGLNPMSRH